MPIMERMTKCTDLDEYLELFESHMTGLEFHKAAQSNCLQPLLNDECRMVLMSMSPDDRQDYNKVKEDLLETCSMQHI